MSLGKKLCRGKTWLLSVHAVGKVMLGYTMGHVREMLGYREEVAEHPH